MHQRLGSGVAVLASCETADGGHFEQAF